MILTVDVGNTNITIGVFDGDKIQATFRLTTKMARTSDEYAMILTSLLEQNDIKHEEILDVIIASVVPNVMHSLEGAIVKYFGIRPIVIEPGTKTGIRVVTENPRQIGADRIVDAAAAYGIYGEYSCKRDHFKYAGRTCLWTDRTDRIYRPSYDRGIWSWRGKSSGNGRPWTYHSK